MSIEIKIPS